MASTLPTVMRTAWDTLAAPVLVIDAEGKIHYANGPARDIVADAKNISEFAPESADRLSGACTGGPVRVETALDGRTFTVLAARLSVGDTPMAAVLMHESTHDRDLAGVQQTRIEDLESAVEEGLADLQWERSDLAQLRRSVEALAFSLGHDLQEPVRDVASCLHLIEPHVPPDQISLMVDAKNATERLARLVTGLLAYSKAARREVRRRSRTTMAEVLDSPLCGMQRKRIVERGGGVEVEGEDVPIAATREGLSVIVGEFLMNAVRHGARPPVVQISVAPEADGTRVDVRDNGGGYPVDVLAGFPRRATASRGFGLAIIQLTVAQLQGVISLDNDEGAHAVLRFTETQPDLETEPSTDPPDA